MSSRRGGGSGAKLPTAAKGKNVLQVSDRCADQVAERVSDISLGSEQAGGGWEEVARKPRNRSVGNVGSQYSSAKVSRNHWKESKGPSNAWKKTKQPVNAWTGKGSVNAFAAPAGCYKWPASSGRGFWNQASSIEYENNYDQPAVIPPLEKGWQWRGNTSQVAKVGNVSASNPAYATYDKEEEIYDDIDSNEDDFNTEDFYNSDEYDSDESQTSHKTLKKTSLLKGFFKTLDEMKLEEIRQPDRQWHCPACADGPGAIDWYRGLQALITHAKTKGKRRMDSQEEFYKEQIRLIHEARIEKEDIFKQIQQQKRENVKNYIGNHSPTEDHLFRIQKGATFILSQQKEMDNFADERDKLLKDLAEKKAELKRQRYEEDVKLEKEFDAELVRLMEKYSLGKAPDMS